MKLKRVKRRTERSRDATGWAWKHPDFLIDYDQTLIENIAKKNRSRFLIVVLFIKKKFFGCNFFWACNTPLEKKNSRPFQ